MPQHRVVIYVDEDVHARLKTVLASEGRTVTSWFRLEAAKKIGRRA